MISEEIKKMFRRIEIDKSNDSCGFEFADGFDCTFDNIATCYDDRLKLYDLVKKLQQENNQLKENNLNMLEEMCRCWKKLDLYKSVIDEVREYIEKYSSFINYLSPTREKEIGSLEMKNVRELLEILDKVNKENVNER